MRRLLDIPANSESVTSVQECLALLDNIWVYDVPYPRVKHTYRLEDVSHTESRFVGVERDDDDLNILISRQCPPDKRDIYICKELHRLFADHHIPAAALLTAFAFPPHVLDDFYASPGVESVGPSPEGSVTTELPAESDAESTDYRRSQSPLESLSDRASPPLPHIPEREPVSAPAPPYMPYLSPPETPAVPRAREQLSVPSDASTRLSYDLRRIPDPPVFTVPGKLTTMYLG